MPLDQELGAAGAWPPEFDPALYSRGKVLRFLRLLPPQVARWHYDHRGRARGRVANAAPDRGSFLAHISPGAKILEIGPFSAPVFRRDRYDVAYLDVLDTDQLRARAGAIEGYDPAGVHDIDYVWRGERLPDLIPDRFDVVFSSHNLEHQTCLISHLEDLDALLKPGGVAAMFIPDRRYCFDAFQPETTLVDVLAAWFDPGPRHKARDVVKYWLFSTHNDCGRLWKGDRGFDPWTRTGPEQGQFMRELKAQYRQTNDYIDVHAWQFSPDSFRAIIQRLFDLGLSPLAPARVYPTVRGSNEFAVVLTRR